MLHVIGPEGVEAIAEMAPRLYEWGLKQLSATITRFDEQVEALIHLARRTCEEVGAPSPLSERFTTTLLAIKRESPDLDNLDHLRRVSRFYKRSIPHFVAFNKLFKRLETHVAYPPEARAKLARVSQPENSESGDEPVNRNIVAVHEILSSLPPGRGLSGPEILDKLAAQGIRIGLSTFQSHYVPVLKKRYGMRNKPGAGYYIPPNGKSQTSR